MRALFSHAAMSAMILMAPNADQGGGVQTQATDTSTAQPRPDPVAGVAPAVQPVAPAQPPAPAPDKDTAKPTKAGKAKTTPMIWVAAGHEIYGIGQLVHFPEADADALRSAGRARPASKDEVKALASANAEAD